MHEEPLLLIPPHAREKILDALNRKTRSSYSLRLDLDLSPVSRLYYDQLLLRICFVLMYHHSRYKCTVQPLQSR